MKSKNFLLPFSLGNGIHIHYCNCVNDEGENYYEKVIQIHPNHSKAYNNLGNVQEELNKKQQTQMPPKVYADMELNFIDYTLVSGGGGVADDTPWVDLNTKGARKRSEITRSDV